MNSNKHASLELKERALSGTGLEKVSTQDIYREIIRRFDADPTRDGLERTPERVEKAMEFLTKGYGRTRRPILQRRAVRRGLRRDGHRKGHRDVLAVRTPHAAFFRQGSRRLYSQRQSNRVEQDCPAGGGVRSAPAGAGAAHAADRGCHQEAIHPQGVGVVIEARHLCMMMRGVEKQNSSTVTSAMVGFSQPPDPGGIFLAGQGAAQSGI